MRKKSIIMIGAFPPPIGGVSIHVIRLVQKLKEKYQVFEIDTSKNKFILGFKILNLFIYSTTKKSQFIVHNHVFRIRFNAIIVFLCKIFRVKYIQTIHSFRYNMDNLSGNEIYLFKFINNYSSKIIVVSDKIKSDLINFDNNISKKIDVIPAFIPYGKKYSIIQSEQYIDNLNINNFISSHTILLCANASKIVFYKGEDLYGIDLCIEVMKNVKNSTNYNTGFIFMLPQIGDMEYFNNMKNRIIEYRLEDDFIFINKKVDLVPLFEYVDIFLRPTNSDGDAISIRESLYSGIPTIASDVVERPSGTVIFKNRSVIDLYEKVLKVIENNKEEKQKAKVYGNLQEKYIEKYFLLYDSI